MASTLPFAIVVMGVSGCGKSTVASRVAERLRWDFAEADSFHSAANVQKMQSGIPLTDADRWPWLDAIAAWIEGKRREGRHCIVACSALKRIYRERLAQGHDDVRFVYLRGSYETIAGRMSGRTGHYMPMSLLKSQFDTLEEPAADENATILSIDRAPDELVDSIIAPFGLSPGTHRAQ